MTDKISYIFCCEYCGEEYTVTQELQFLSARERKKIQKNAEKWKYAVPKSGKCPHCGFVPTFMINRVQTIGVIVFLIILFGVNLIPLFVSDPPVSLTIVMGLICYLPIVIALVFLTLRLTPNRKLLKELSSTDRQLSPPTRPQIFFGPVPQAGERMTKQEIIREIEQLGSTDAGLKMALSPLLDMLTRGTAINNFAAATTLAQLADGFEQTGVADAATISKLRKIAAALETLKVNNEVALREAELRLREAERALREKKRALEEPEVQPDQAESVDAGSVEKPVEEARTALAEEKPISEISMDQEPMPQADEIERLITDLQNPDKHVRKTAIEALRQTGDERVIQPLIACLNDEDFLTKWAAEKAVGSFGALAFEPLMAAFKGPDVEMRAGAAGALGRLGDNRPVEPLLAALETEEKKVRGSIIRALGGIGDERAVAPLIKALADEGLRAVAAESLGKLGDLRAVEPLISILADSQIRIRKTVITALGKLGDVTAVEALVPLVSDPDLEVAERAADALTALGHPEYMTSPGLKKVKRQDVIRQYEDGKKWFGERNLAGVDLSDQSLVMSIFRESDLTGAVFKNSNLGGVNFKNANLTGANLNRASLRMAELQGTNLAGADLSWAMITTADLEGANLRGANLFSASLFRSNLKGADLTGADVTMADLGEATLPDGAVYRRGMDLSRYGMVGNPQTSL